MGQHASQEKIGIFHRTRVRTIMEVLWVIVFGFSCGLGMFFIGSVIVSLIDSFLGLAPVSGATVAIFLILGGMGLLVGVPGMTLYFGHRKLLRMWKTEWFEESDWYDVARFPPIWLMVVIAVPAYFLAVGMWVFTVVLPPLSFIALPLFVPIPLIIPGIFWLAYGSNLKKNYMVPLMVAFFWGIMSTFPSLIFNSAGASGLALIFAANSPWPAFLSTSVVAPLVEETMKPLAIFFMFKYIKDERDGFMFGVAMGIGFAVLENFIYIINSFGTWGVLILIRSYNMVLHAIGPALIGYFIGKARRKQSFGPYVLIFLGWFTGVVIHMLWNGSSSLGALVQNLNNNLLNTTVCLTTMLMILIFPLLENLFLLLIGLRAKKVVQKVS